MYYTLKNKKVIATENYKEWSLELSNPKNQLFKTYFKNKSVFISTIFLGIDTSISNQKPIVFETMVFGGVENHYIERYSTYKEAIKGHKRICKLAKGKRTPRKLKKKLSKITPINTI